MRADRGKHNQVTVRLLDDVNGSLRNNLAPAIALLYGNQFLDGRGGGGKLVRLAYIRPGRRCGDPEQWMKHKANERYREQRTYAGCACRQQDPKK